MLCSSSEFLNPMGGASQISPKKGSQAEVAESARLEQRTYSILHAPAHPCTVWNRVVADSLQRRHTYISTELKQAPVREKKFAKELRRFIEDIERRETQVREQQERECSRVGALLGASVSKRWHTIGSTFAKQVRVEFEVVRQRKAQKKQEELLKETEMMTSQLISWVLERKRSAQKRNIADGEDAAVNVPQQVADAAPQLPDLEQALGVGQERFDETKSLLLFNSLNGKRPLRDYQRTALQWMINLYTNDLNGILADEMGLGKTVQTIALLCYFAQYRQDWGPHLIVVPTTVVLNWQTELLRWAPGLKVLTCIGSREERVEIRKGWSKPGVFDVCITSYSVFMRDQDSFRRMHWGFLVLDEAHHIKNFASQKWQALYELKTSYRLLLTGTPLQNNVMELWSLFHFLMPSANAFASREEFEAWFSNPMNDMVSGKAALNEELVRRLQALIRPFLLRRLKKDVEAQLPSKTTKVIKCHLSPRQQSLYDEFLNLKNTKQAIRSGGYQGVLSVILSLRKVCNHPDLFEPRPIVSPFVMLAHEPLHLNVPSLILLNGNAPGNVFNVRECGSKLTALLGVSLPTSRCLGIYPRSLLRETESFAQRAEVRKHLASAKRQAHLKSVVPNMLNPSSLPQWFQLAPTSATPIIGVAANSDAMLSSTSAWDLPVESLRRLIQPTLVSTLLAKCRLDPPINNHSDRVGCSPNTFRTSVRLEQLVEDVSLSSSLSCVLAKISIIVPRCVSTTNASTGTLFGGTSPQLVCSGAVRCWRPFRQLTMRDITLQPPTVCHSAIESAAEQLAWISHNRGRTKTHTDVGYFHSGSAPNGYILPRGATAGNFPVSDAHWSLTTARALNFPDKSMLIHDSGKLQILSTLLPKLKAGNHRCLIFSQFTVMLDILQRFIAMKGFPCLRIDGSTGAAERQDYVERFNRDERITCMILSTRSGGIGLNLVGADTVIFYDSDWNPTIDLQAQDRCHRIGQTRSVTIYRLICSNTVEEQILEKARERERLNSVVIRSGAFHLPAWDHHEKAVEVLKRQGDGLEGEAAGIVASGATSALLSKQDLRGFFKNVSDDHYESDDDDDNATDGNDETAAMEAAMDRVEDDADRSARQAVSKEIRDAAAAEQQDVALIEGDADIYGNNQLNVTEDETSPSQGPAQANFTREELLAIKRQRQQLLTRMAHTVERSLVNNFGRLHAGKAATLRATVEEEFKNASTTASGN